MGYARIFALIPAIGLVSGAAMAQDWSVTGNATSATNFLGTTNNKPLIVKTDNKERLRVQTDGHVAIGTTNATTTVQVEGTYSQTAPVSTLDPVMKLTTPSVLPALQVQNSETSTLYAPGFPVLAAYDNSGSNVGYAVYGQSESGVGVYAYLTTGNDSADKGGHGVAALNAEDNSFSGSYTYAVYANSPENIAVYGTSQNVSAEFQGGVKGGGTVYFNGGGSWNFSSDRHLKEHFTAVDLGKLLDQLDAMPIFTYQMKGSKEPTRYLGPTAQDFKVAFDLDDGDTTINSANAHGVALAAAKGLYRKLKEDEAALASDHALIAAQDAKISADRDIIVLERDEIASLKQLVVEQGAVLASLRASVDRLAQTPPALIEARVTAQ
jgi:hypothetical protein